MLVSRRDEEALEPLLLQAKNVSTAEYVHYVIISRTLVWVNSWNEAR